MKKLRSNVQKDVSTNLPNGQFSSGSFSCIGKLILTTRAAELASSLSQQLDNDVDTDDDSPMPDAQRPLSVVGSQNADPEEARLETLESHKYLLAKAYFDCREFERCAAVFLPPGAPGAALTGMSPNTQVSSPSTSSKGKSKIKPPPRESPGGVPTLNGKPLSQKALFLALYAKYMAGEKKKEEANEMILGPADKGSTVNAELVGISKTLDVYLNNLDQGKASGGWLEYLYGIVLAKSKNEGEAKRWLIRSVHLYPCNWGTWMELNDLISGTQELYQILPELPRDVMSLFFSLHCNQMLYQNSEQVWKQLSDLENIFPDSLFLKTQKALLLYHGKDFEEAEIAFSSILQEDPYRIDALDHYSNILYVMRNRPKLAFVAQLATTIDKFRPETCCVVGNYYSLKSEHEKAVQYFRRALMLDRNFLSAWTLMGHEYVEMKNTHAAIESYRRAVDVNRKDYRAWYGLGQTYEILEMHLYALFYFQRASSLRPLDSTMWNAVGACYDKIGRPAQSIKAYKRALVAGTYYDTTSSFNSTSTTGGTPDPYMVAETLHNIALMYEKLGDIEEAASYMEMTLAQEEGQEADESEEEARASAIGVTNTTSRARMWLARWEFARGGMKRAMDLANELCQDGVEIEEAKALIRDVRARMDNEII